MVDNVEHDAKYRDILSRIEDPVFHRAIAGRGHLRDGGEKPTPREKGPLRFTSSPTEVAIR